MSCVSRIVGRLYWLKVYNVPQGGRASRGKPIVNLLPLVEGEKITAVLPVKEFDENKFVFMATTNGTVKKTPLSDFSRPRPSGIIAVDLDDGDYLIGVALTEGRHDIMLFSDAGKAVRFDEQDVRPMGRGARGVRGMRLASGQNVISLLVSDNENVSVLTATENGYGKRTPMAEYTRHGRGSQGMIAIQTSARNGNVVAATLAEDGDGDHVDYHWRRFDTHPCARNPPDESRDTRRDFDQSGRGRETGRIAENHRYGRRSGR